MNNQFIKQNIFVIVKLSFLLIFLAGCGKENSQKEKAQGQKEDKSARLHSGLDTTKVDISSLPNINSIVLENSYSNIEELTSGLSQNLMDTNVLEAQKLLPKFSEYAKLYYYLPDPDLNPNSGEFMATLYVNGNKKNLPRWSRDFHEKKCVKLITSEPKEIKEGKGYELLSGIQVECMDDVGKKFHFPVFKTVLKIGGKYIIWSILET